MKMNTKIKTNEFVLDFITNQYNFELDSSDKNIVDFDKNLKPRDISFFHIEEITYEEKAPRKEAFENVLSSLRLEGVQFIYLLLGDTKGVQFYFGVVRDLTNDIAPQLPINDIGKNILSSGIRGNFRGSIIKEIDPEGKIALLRKIGNMKSYSRIEGVPGINEDNEDIQGVERIADIMMGEEYGLVIIAKPINNEDISQIEKQLCNAYDKIIPFIKKSIQENKSDTDSSGETNTSNSSQTSGSSDSKGDSKAEGKNNSDSETKGKSFSKAKNDDKITTTNGDNKSNQKTRGSSTTNSTNSNHSDTNSKTEGSSLAKAKNNSVSTGSSCSIEFVNKKAQEWIKYLDDVIIPRLDYGKGKGVFITSTFIFTENRANLIKLSNSLLSLYSGKSGNKVVLKNKEINKSDKIFNYYKNLQIPLINMNTKKSEEILSRVILSQYIKDDKGHYGNWLSTKELSLIAGLPQKEIVGLALREEVEFGLNYNSTGIDPKNSLSLGRLVQSGRVLDNMNVIIDKSNFDKHIFITGVTGSGKTTTCHKLLLDGNLPFLVIEPAKTEYRILADKKYFPDLLVFTLGNNSVSPFKLNPFEFFPHESISSRVDMIKASMEAAFDMEAAIPQILERSIYECYKDYGWNIANNKNSKYSDPFADGVCSFPTLSDLVGKIETVVKLQGFDERLKNDYIGSIKARLQGLTVGAKGLMLNNSRSINFVDLLDKKVVLELEEIRSGSEKSLIMGFILTNLIEALKSKPSKGKLRHLTLVEEAHRLLSKYQAGDSLNKKQGVEVFTDMLAEVRKYGEGLIIVDQIPNKLTPEILKNTNTKIVHKIFANDDKQAIGNSIILKEEQQNFLSNLETGRAIVFTQGWNKPVQVQIDKSTDTSKDENIDNKLLKLNVLTFYQDNYGKGYLAGLEFLDNKPTTNTVEEYMKFLNDNDINRDYVESMNNKQISNELKTKIMKLLGVYPQEFIVNYLLSTYYNKNHERQQERIGLINDIINNILKSQEYKFTKEPATLLNIQN